MTKIELSKRTVKELREMAKELDIKKRWELTKEQMVDAIIQTENHSEESSEEQSVKVEEIIETKEAPANLTTQETMVTPEQRASKQRYINDLKKGTIVAFYVEVRGVRKVKSAAVENISMTRQMLKLITNYGTIYVVPFKDILWVRTGKRWPKGIYDLLKGLKKSV